jgi:hypothetical protein
VVVVCADDVIVIPRVGKIQHTEVAGSAIGEINVASLIPINLEELNML